MAQHWNGSANKNDNKIKRKPRMDTVQNKFFNDFEPTTKA